VVRTGEAAFLRVREAAVVLGISNRPMWLNAWGKLPIISALVASTSLGSSPTSLIAAMARSKVAVARSSSPASACACASQNVQSRKVPSSPARRSCAR
jgi:hypothetical protein